jgi:hypothetical protein
MAPFGDYSDREFLGENNALDQISDLQTAARSQARREALVNSLDDLTGDLGVMSAGQFRAVDEDGDIHVIISAVNLLDPLGINGYLVTLKKSDQSATWWVDAETGEIAALGGALKIGQDGITANLLSDIITQIADNGATYRKLRLGMFTLPGSTGPSGGINYQDNSVQTELITNGDFETGDFTGWTAVGGTWSVTTFAGFTSYCAKSQNASEKNQTFAVIAGGIYLFRCRLGIATSISVQADFYSGAAGSGTLLASNIIGVGTATPTTYTKIIAAPTGAVSCVLRLMNTASQIGYYDDISVQSNPAANYIGFEPADGKLISSMLDGGDVPGQIPVGAMSVPRVEEATDKLVATPGGAGNVNVGTHYAIVTFVDQYGESDADLSQSTSIVISTSAKTVALSAIPLGKWGTTSRRVWVTAAGATQTDPTAYKLLATIGDNTTTTATYNTADASLSATTIPMVNTTGSRPIFPRCSVIMADEIISSNANWGRVVQTLQPYNFHYQVPAANSANGDTFQGAAWIEAGTYTLHELGYTGPTVGKIDVYLDGAIIASGQDWYSAGGTYNVEKTISSVVVPTSGYHHLKFVVNGKTGSNYVWVITKIWFTPAAY